MFKQRKTGWLAIISSLILAALLLSACSVDIPAETVPTDNESDGADASEDTKVISDISDIFEETGNGTPSNNTTDALPADTEIDVNGIPIGFTENGNPYRGNPNAPVVIEEFSDFQ